MGAGAWREYVQAARIRAAAASPRSILLEENRASMDAIVS